MSTTCDISAGQDYCPHCSSSYQFIYHGGHCPLVKAKEYDQAGNLRRIEFHESQPSTQRVAGLHPGAIWASEDFDEPMALEDSYL